MSILFGIVAYFLIATPIAVILGDILKSNRRRYAPIKSHGRSSSHSNP